MEVWRWFYFGINQWVHIWIFVNRLHKSTFEIGKQAVKCTNINENENVSIRSKDILKESSAVITTSKWEMKDFICLYCFQSCILKLHYFVRLIIERFTFLQRVNLLHNLFSCFTNHFVFDSSLIFSQNNHLL